MPAILLILQSIHEEKKKISAAFLLFSIVIFRAFIPEKIILSDVSFWAGMIRALLISSLFLIKKVHLSGIYFYFKKYLFFILLISLPFFLLHAIGFDPFGRIATYIGEEGAGRIWNVYLFFSLQDHPSHGEMLRFPAIFDEPGFLGVLLAFVLSIERFNFKNKRNRFFALCGILTFSMAFYLLSIIYFFSAAHVNMKLKKYTIVFITFFIMLGALFFPVQMNNKIFDRFYTDEGFFWHTSGRVGIERQTIAIENMRSLTKSELLWGRGLGGDSESISTPGVTWERLVVRLGIVCTVLFILLIFWYGSKNRNSFVFSLLFVISLLHRPVVFIPLWFFLLVYGIIVGESDEVIKEKNAKRLLFKKNEGESYAGFVSIDTLNYKKQ